MRRVAWSGPARRDLAEIETWLAENRPPAFELQTLQAIHKRAQLLLANPHGAPFVQGEKRKLLVTGTPYIIIYRVLESDVEVLRLFHERQDWQAKL